MKTLKLFVAGSKELSNERNLFKIIANDLQAEMGNRGRNGAHIEVRTFENFDYFFGEHLKGAQESYNQYIATDADAVFFVFDDKVGGVTREEFDVAYEAFKSYGHPRICVFSKLTTDQSNEDIAKLRKLCSDVGQYYTDYVDQADLCNKIERSIRQLCNAKISGALITPFCRKKKTTRKSVEKKSTQHAITTSTNTTPSSFNRQRRVNVLFGVLLVVMLVISFGGIRLATTQVKGISEKKYPMSRVSPPKSLQLSNVSITYFDEVKSFSEGLACARKDGCWGFVNTNYDIVIPLVFEDVFVFNNGFAPIKYNGKWGFVDKLGCIIAKPQYDSVSNFSENFAGVELGGKFGFINTKGELVVPIIYDDIWAFSKGRARVLKNGAKFYINTLGEQITEKQ